MLDGHGHPVLAPDYEDPSLAHDPAYDADRDPFTATFSPPLPAGLNLGRQLHHIETTEPALFARVAAILPYPQYWAFVLSGVLASEATSLGCHTDLWLPAERAFSPLATRRGWAGRFAPVRPAREALGPIRSDIAARCGLPPDCMILCGIHDSNASYLQHRAHRAPDEPFAVVSSGTWTIVMASHTPLDRLDPARDMLANVDAFGDPVATARFMGGRDFETIAAGHGEARASEHVAQRTAEALEQLGAAGDIVIDGPLAHNPLVPGLLAGLRPASRVWRARAAAGPGGGAACLLLGEGAPPPVLDAV
jgi:sugar (pentulose or hexulose) kinase